MHKKFFLILFAACLISIPAARAEAVLTLDPADGAIGGPAGSTVGWGFTFSNDTGYALITGSQFCAPTSTMLPDGCVAVALNIGTYLDFAGALPNVIGPSPEIPFVSQTFDNSLQTGIGSFSLDPSATGTVSGLLVLSYDLYSDDPNDPNRSLNDEISADNAVAAPASVTVGPVTETPEPEYLPLLGAGSLAAVLYRRRLRIHAQH
jgi:hypothetical protein